LRYTVPDRSQLIDSKRRDVGVVDRARLEIGSLHARRPTPNPTNVFAINDFTQHR